MSESLLYFSCLEALKKPGVVLKDSSTPLPVNKSPSKSRLEQKSSVIFEKVSWEGPLPYTVVSPPILLHACVLLHSQSSHTIPCSFFVPSSLQPHRLSFILSRQRQMLPETGKNSAIVFPKVKSTERKGKVLKCNRLCLRCVDLHVEISINTIHENNPWVKVKLVLFWNKQ